VGFDFWCFTISEELSRMQRSRSKLLVVLVLALLAIPNLVTSAVASKSSHRWDAASSSIRPSPGNFSGEPDANSTVPPAPGATKMASGRQGSESQTSIPRSEIGMWIRAAGSIWMAQFLGLKR
jgi:hypothetical protein